MDNTRHFLVNTCAMFWTSDVGLYQWVLRFPNELLTYMVADFLFLYVTLSVWFNLVAHQCEFDAEKCFKCTGKLRTTKYINHCLTCEQFAPLSKGTFC